VRLLPRPVFTIPTHRGTGKKPDSARGRHALTAHISPTNTGPGGRSPGGRGGFSPGGRGGGRGTYSPNTINPGLATRMATRDGPAVAIAETSGPARFGGGVGGGAVFPSTIDAILLVGRARAYLVSFRTPP